VAIEIPKPLLLADVAVRAIWPPYDPLTRQIERRTGEDGDKNGPEDTAEKTSTIADLAESVQLENNEVPMFFECHLFAGTGNCCIFVLL